MHFPSLLTFALAIESAVITCIPGAHVIHERRVSPPQYEMKQQRAWPDARLFVRIGLTQPNVDLGPQRLKEVSDPKSPSYGQHWTAKQIVEYFAPSDETFRSVSTWLSEAGIGADREALTTKRGWIWVEATVAEMEALLKTGYHDFQHGKTGERQIGCDEYSIPASIRPHVDLVTPTVGFSERGRYRKSVRKQVEQVDGNSGRHFALDPYSNQIALAGGSDPSASLANCGRGMTPACIAGRFPSLPCTICKAIDHSCIYVYTAFLQKFH